jgi:hypothetical protein
MKISILGKVIIISRKGGVVDSRQSLLVTVLVLLVFVSLPVSAQAADNPAETKAADMSELTWPRVFQPDGHEVILYQPQLEEWKDHTLCIFLKERKI